MATHICVTIACLLLGRFKLTTQKRTFFHHPHVLGVLPYWVIKCKRPKQCPPTHLPHIMLHPLTRFVSQTTSSTTCPHTSKRVSFCNQAWAPRGVATAGTGSHIIKVYTSLYIIYLSLCIYQYIITPSICAHQAPHSWHHMWSRKHTGPIVNSEHCTYLHTYITYRYT